MAEAQPLHRRYFSEFLPGILGKLLIEDLTTLTTCFEIRVTDGSEPPWRLGIEEGCLTYVGHQGPEPVCRFSLDSDTFVAVVTARCTPSAAFFDTRIDLEGDMEMGLKLSTVLEPFFHRFPCPG
jgi:hypothetical protein